MKVSPSLQNLFTRTIAGFFFVALVIAALLLGPWALGVIFLGFTIIGLRECYHLVNKQPSVIPRYTGGYIGGILIYSLVFLHSIRQVSPTYYLFIIPFVVLLLSTELIYREKYSLTHFGATLAGWVYVVIPFSLINILGCASGEYDYTLPLGYFLLLWTNDTGAYLSGRWLGRHKLYEKISPNKTWEGLVGGIVLAVAVSFLLWRINPEIEKRDWIAMAAIIAVFANLGDLFESLVKRGVGVKDSGNLIPGHGGVLDRFDGLLLSLPLVIFYLKIFVFK